MMDGREKPGIGADEAEVNKYLTNLACEMTSFNPKEGFFNHFVEQIDEQVSSAYFEKFGKLKTDEERILDTWAIKPIHTLKVQSFYKEKDSQLADFYRQKGNKAYQEKENFEAVVMYSRAVLKAPNNSEACLSLSYANRSAVLFHMGYYDLCLNDIDLAIEAAYPADLMYKVLDRRGQCYIKLGQFSKAKEAFQAAEVALSDSILDPKKVEAWKKDLSRKIQMCEGKTDKDIPSKKGENDESLFAGSNPALPNASSAVAIRESEEAGRYAVVTRPMGTGQVLMAEDPYAFVLKSDRHGTHCLHCCKRLIVPVACLWCSHVAFCSRKCRDTAIDGYHKWECKFMDLYVGSGMSLNSSLALRLITQHPLEFFKELKPRLKEHPGLPTDENPHRPNDYVSVYNMVALEDQRTPEDFLRRSLMACFLLKALQRAHYFGTWEEDGPPDKELTEDELFIGSLLLRHLQVLQFNSHEITSLFFENDIPNFSKTKNVYIGLAIYPTVSFCNHSCVPTVARFFDQGRMVVLNLRPLEAGEILAENYGPVFSHHELHQRQQKLLTRYWFTCKCEACENKWPIYDNMGVHRKLKCQSCSQSLNLIDPKKTQVKCNCGKSTDVKEHLAVVSNTEDLFIRAKKQMDNIKREEAIKTYLQYIDIINKYVNPPVKEVCISMDNLRLLIAARGSIQISNPFKNNTKK